MRNRFVFLGVLLLAILVIGGLIKQKILVDQMLSKRGTYAHLEKLRSWGYLESIESIGFLTPSFLVSEIERGVKAANTTYSSLGTSDQELRRLRAKGLAIISLAKMRTLNAWPDIERANIKQHLIKANLSLKDIGTSDKELNILARRIRMDDIQSHVNTLRLGRGCGWSEPKDCLEYVIQQIKELETESEEEISFEKFGTTRREMLRVVRGFMG